MTEFDKLFNELPSDIDCVLITSDVNRRYFTGMKSSDGTVIAFRDKAYLIIDFRYIEKARASVTSAEVIEQTSHYNQLDSLIREHSARNIAIESQSMTVSELNSLKRHFSEIEIIDTDLLSNAINSLRMVKDDYEISCIQKAQEIAELAFDGILDFIKEGVTEREIAMELERIMAVNGSEGVSFETIVLSGANTSMPHGVPSDKPVKNGEFILMDYGAVYNGYHSDMTRTVCLGEPTDEMREVYNLVLQAQETAINSARSGMTGRELDLIARSIIEEAGYGDYFGHSLGHGVGLEIHEKPNASERNSHKLNENAVVTIEPGIYIEGKFGVRIEDFVVLHKNGCINLTKSAKNIVSL
ncbi:MAG: aminopeptidase P family protein [Ruminococcus flavefaciens]|nr:aminopeptidase P family protein [Ruminococcus flavefaciens]MCM1230576.1 aminopeptidase P family protein [Ruminococcus flavefaciens]